MKRLAIVVFGVAAPVAVLAGPSKADPPLKVFVYALDDQVSFGPSVKPGSAVDAAAEITRRLAARKAWFAPVEGQAQAEVKVAIGIYGIEMAQKRTIETTGASKDGTVTTRDGVAVVEKHHVKAKLILPMGDSPGATQIVEGRGSTLVEAADQLSKTVEDAVRASYSKLVRPR